MEHTSLENNLFCIWSGNNKMSDNRKKCLESIYVNSGCKVLLIDKLNIDNYIKADYPLHKSYEYLSFTHQADYLRAYLMYHYGGGYTDIKYNNTNWNKYFQLLNQSNKQFFGYAEISPSHIASKSAIIKQHYHKLAGIIHFVFKKQSQFAKTWLSTVNDILDQKYDLLKSNPGHYHPRAVYGGAFQTDLFKNARYPLEWNEILGRIFHEICFNNIDVYDLNMHYPKTLNYR